MAKFTLILISLWLSTLYASSLIATFELWPTLSNVPFNYTHASKTEPQTMGGRFQHGSFAYKDKLFVFGGLATSNDTTSIADGTIWSYHPLTKTWKLEFDPENETQSSTPHPIYVMLNGNYDVYGNTLYVWGGVLNVNGTNQPNNTIWSLDIDEMKWSLLGGGSDIDVYSNDGTGMPPSYSGNCISYHNGKLYSYGGSTTPSTGLPVKTRTADFWIFNLTDNKFYLIKGNGSFIPTVYDSTIGSTDSLDCFIRQEKFYVVSNDVWTIDLATYSESLYMQLVPNGNYNESNGDLSPPATYYRIGYTLKDYYVIYGGQPGRQEDTIWGLDLNNKKWYLLFGSDIDGFYSTTGSVFSDGIGIIGSVANTDIIFSEFYNKSFVIAGNKYYDEYSQVPSNDVWSFSCDSESGTFGPLCLNCTCAHGICNDGIYGDGTCSSCYDGYEGENCNIQVDKDETITHATSVDTTLATNEETTGQTSYIQSTVESTQGTVILDVSISTSYSEGDQSTTDSNDETSNQNNNETYVADNISSANVGVLTPGSVAGIVITVVIVGVIIILIVFFVTKRKKIQPTKRYDNNAKLGGNTPHISLSESGSDIISSLESSFYVSDSSGICSGDDMS